MFFADVLLKELIRDIEFLLIIMADIKAAIVLLSHDGSTAEEIKFLTF
jgi:hypothetical protein